MYRYTYLVICFLLMFVSVNTFGEEPSQPVIRGAAFSIPGYEHGFPVVGEELAAKVTPPQKTETIKRRPLFSSASTYTMLLDTVEFDSYLKKGTYLTVDYDLSTHTLDCFIPPETLSADAIHAIELAPSWTRDQLYEIFSRLPAAKQDRYADLIINPGDERYRDEIAFTIANLSTGYTNNNAFQQEIIRENVRLIYEIEPFLDYVEIVDYGDHTTRDDYYTTLRYTISDMGVPVTYEIPMDIYYWYVVHIKMSEDTPRFIDPTADGDGNGTAVDPPVGLWWRDYLYYDDPSRSYVEHYLMKTPANVTLADISAWGPSTYGYFEGYTKGPLEIVLHGVAGKPALIEIALGNGSIDISTKTGRVLATMMPVEKGYEGGHPELLRNMVIYGRGNAELPMTGQILILKDRDPWGIPSVEKALADMGRTFTVKGSADIATLDLNTYAKVIVPSNQPRVLYETIEANRTTFETWIKNNKVFQFHGAADGSDDWAGLLMPGPFTCAPQASTHTDNVIIKGQPFLQELMTGIPYMWDSKTNDILDGDRVFDPADQGIKRLSFWTGQNLWDSVQEYDAKHGPYERSFQPVRIAYNHYGNCGEIQDLMIAAGRTCLIPMKPITDYPEDHVWCEFYCNGSWYSLDVYPSDRWNLVAAPGNMWDKDNSGHYDCSLIASWRGDSMFLNEIDHYSNTVTLDITLTDGNDRPLDGVQINFASNNMYTPSSVDAALFVFTDKDGKASVKLGDKQHHYIQVQASRITGAYPSTGYLKVIDSAAATPGAHFTWSRKFTETVDMPDPVLWSKPVPPDYPYYRVEIEMESANKVCLGTNFTDSKYCREFYEPGNLDLYIVNGTDYPKFLSGPSFFTEMMVENTDLISCGYDLPPGDDYHVILSNRDSVEFMTKGTYTVNLFEVSDVPYVPVTNTAWKLIAVILISGLVAARISLRFIR